MKNLGILGQILSKVEGMMQSYPPRVLDRRLQEAWIRATKEGPRVLMNLRVDFWARGSRLDPFFFVNVRIGFFFFSTLLMLGLCMILIKTGGYSGDMIPTVHWLSILYQVVYFHWFEVNLFLCKFTCWTLLPTGRIYYEKGN